jgi:hypothetical protein
MKKVFALSALLVLATMPSVYACESSGCAAPEEATTPAASTCESSTHATPKAKAAAAVAYDTQAWGSREPPPVQLAYDTEAWGSPEAGTCAGQ